MINIIFQTKTNGRIRWALSIFIGVYIIFWLNPEFASGAGAAKDDFSEAQASYQQGIKSSGAQRRMLMLKAANQFLSLVDNHGIKNGKLYYNIGNAFFEAGEKGQALLYYRKAEKLIPGFIDLKYNLNLARQELQLSESKKAWWSDIVRGLFFWHYMFDYSARRTISIILFTLFWIVMTGMIFSKTILIKLVVILNLVALTAFGASFVVSAYSLYFVEAGVITSIKAPVRKGPGLSYEKVYEQELPAGTEFRLLKKQGDWWKVRLSNGEDLWLHEDNGELI